MGPFRCSLLFLLCYVMPLHPSPPPPQKKKEKRLDLNLEIVSGQWETLCADSDCFSPRAPRYRTKCKRLEREAEQGIQGNEPVVSQCFILIENQILWSHFLKSIGANSSFHVVFLAEGVKRNKRTSWQDSSTGYETPRRSPAQTGSISSHSLFFIMHVYWTHLKWFNMKWQTLINNWVAMFPENIQELLLLAACF